MFMDICGISTRMEYLIFDDDGDGDGDGGGGGG